MRSSSASVSIDTPLPCDTRRTGTSSVAASSSTASRQAGPSTLGISMRNATPSGNRLAEADASSGRVRGHSDRFQRRIDRLRRIRPHRAAALGENLRQPPRLGIQHAVGHLVDLRQRLHRAREGVERDRGVDQVPIARERGVDGEPLHRDLRLVQGSARGREEPVSHRTHSVRVDGARHLDARVGRQVLDRPPVADVAVDHPGRPGHEAVHDRSRELPAVTDAVPPGVLDQLLVVAGRVGRTADREVVPLAIEVAGHQIRGLAEPRPVLARVMAGLGVEVAR